MYKPKYLDICWEFADTDFFLVDGDVLVNLLVEENLCLYPVSDFDCLSAELQYYDLW